MLNGKDIAGNEVTVEKKVLSLDLDIPNAPVITSNAGYAILTTSGVKFDATLTITYDSRTDINNYYSIDNGTTWLLYTGQFNMVTGTIITKSIKKNTGLEVNVSKTVSMPSDALKSEAYDNNDATYVAPSNLGNQYLQVDSIMAGKNIRVYSYFPGASENYLIFMDANKVIISSFYQIGGDKIYTIPINCKWISYSCNTSGNKLYEIQPSNEPTFSSTNGYMLLTADPTNSIKEPYQAVTVNYFVTSVQRLYRIGTTGNWLNYNDQPINVSVGQTIYSKGIDGYGNETRITSSYTSNVVDALKKEAFDGSDTTYVAPSNLGNQYIQVDSSMAGKNIRVYSYFPGASENYLTFMDVNKAIISSFYQIGGDKIYTIPTNCKWISYSSNTIGNKLYEIQPSNEPTFSAINGYMLLASNSINSIREPYQMLTINYFVTSVQRLYRIGVTGDWLNYNDQSIKVNQGQTIYAKGIDGYGNETRITSSYTSNVIDALKKEAFDGNDTTYVAPSNLGNQYIQVDSSMAGKDIRVYSYFPGASQNYLTFMDTNKATISSFYQIGGDKIYTIPINCKWISYSCNTTGNKLYEIGPKP